MTTSRQNRPAPAFQEYAAAMMSSLAYRTLTLPQRGLLYTMRLECWVNKSLPAQPDILARMLGYDHAEIVAELPYVMPFFECENEQITSPELEGYRSYIEGIRERQSEGGKATAEKRYGRRSRVKPAGAGKQASKQVGDLQASNRYSNSSLVQSSTAQPSQGEERLTTSHVSREVLGWSDFTTDPDDEGGA